MLRKDELLNEKEKLFNEANELLRAEEIDEKAINEKQMRMSEINGMIKALDDKDNEEEKRSELGPQLVENPVEENKEDEYRSEFENYIRKEDFNKSVLRAQSIGTDAKGGYLVPTDLDNKIVELRTDQSAMRKLGSVMSFSGDLDVPIQGTTPSAEYIAENGAYPTDEDLTLGIMNFKAHKFGRTILVSEELLADSKFNITSYIAKKMVEQNIKLEESYFISGTGTNQAKGVLVDAETGVTAASATAITDAEIMELLFSLKGAYTSNAKLLMNRATLGKVRALWEANTQTFFLELVNGTYYIEGIEVVISAGMPDIATGNAPIAFGDFSYYQIADRFGFQVKVLDQLYAANGQVGYRWTGRGDAKLLVPESVKKLVMA